MKLIGAFEFWSVKLSTDQSEQLYRFNLDTRTWQQHAVGEWNFCLNSDSKELNSFRQRELSPKMGTTPFPRLEKKIIYRKTEVKLYLFF